MAFLFLHLRPCSYEDSAEWLPGSFSGVWRVQHCSKRHFLCLAKAPETAEGIWWMPVPFSPVAKRLLWQRLGFFWGCCHSWPWWDGQAMARKKHSCDSTRWRCAEGFCGSGLVGLFLSCSSLLWECRVCPLSGTAPRSWAGPSPRRRRNFPSGRNQPVPAVLWAVPPEANPYSGLFFERTVPSIAAPFVFLAVKSKKYHVRNDWKLMLFLVLAETWV